VDKQKTLDNILKDPTIKGVVFDFDGVIVDLFVDWVGLKQKLKSKFFLNREIRLNDILAKVNKKLGSEGLKDAYNLVESYELKLPNKAIVNKNILGFLNNCYIKKIKLGILSNNMKKTINYFLDKLGVKNLFNIIVAKEDVQEYKPDSEGLKLIIDKWKIDLDNIIFIGSDENDKICGERAGIKTFII
jgi:phosphoglycolate phosphatase-like HAD superfamily hydrolase